MGVTENGDLPTSNCQRQTPNAGQDLLFAICHLSWSPRLAMLGVTPSIASRGDHGILPASFAKIALCQLVESVCSLDYSPLHLLVSPKRRVRRLLLRPSRSWWIKPARKRSCGTKR